MAAYAGLVNLMNIIDRIQRHTRFPICPDQKQMEALRQKVCFLIDFLESDPMDTRAKDLEGQISRLANAAEDIIETHAVKIITATSLGQTNKNSSTLSFLSSIEKVLEDMDLIKVEIRIKVGIYSEKVFAQESCPLELEEIGRTIAGNCKGLPLSIVVIGGLLAMSDKRKEYWEYVVRETKSVISLEGDEQCINILSLSYQNLPVHLKPCFLYIGVFPEDKEIHVSLLINLWVAEGFLKPNSSKDMELVGQEYLNDLISRNLIFVYRRGSDGKIKSCNIHDLLRDICLREGQKEKFMYVRNMNSHDGGQDISSERRISVHRSSSNEEHLSQVLNAVKFGSTARSFICDLDGLLPLQNFRLLRVLKAADKHIYERCEIENRYLFIEIFQLVNSRYIAIKGLQNSMFSSSACLLWNLQILIVKGIYDDVVAPLEIWEMTELRHLEIWRCCLPDPPIQQIDRWRDEVGLVNLQTMMRIRNLRCSDEIVMRIPNIKKLKISYDQNIDGKLNDCLENIGLLEKLESLTCTFRPNCPAGLLSNLAFPILLKKLRLFGCYFQREDLRKIGSLPNLEVLKLYNSSFIEREWIAVEGEFCRLKFLQLSYVCHLMHWMVEGTHFPRLERLVLRQVLDLVEIPSGVGEIPTLQSINVKCCPDSVIFSAKKILEEQEDLGNVGLQVQVCFNMYSEAEVEGLDSDNFQVSWDA